MEWPRTVARRRALGALGAALALLLLWLVSRPMPGCDGVASAPDAVRCAEAFMRNVGNAHGEPASVVDALSDLTALRRAMVIWMSSDSGRYRGSALAVCEREAGAWLVVFREEAGPLCAGVLVTGGGRGRAMVDPPPTCGRAFVKAECRVLAR